MARKPRDPEAQGELDAAAEETQVTPQMITYMPGDQDPTSVKWRRMTFHANVPKEVSDPDMIEAARGNSHFKVGSFDANNDRAPEPDFTGTPKNSVEYRAHVAAFLKGLKVANAAGEPNVRGIDDMIKQWAAEQSLRELCDVGSDDFSYIGSLFLPKMHDLQKVAELNDGQLAEKWKSYGIFQLPF